jgi:diguanylate cyclase (GGDEF)-like protein/PAS domain S-box-containing protein
MSNDKELKQLVNEVSGVAIYAIDENRVITEWNKTSEVIYGYTKDEAIGKKIEELILQDHQKDGFISDLNSKITYTAKELEHKRKDGSLAIVLANTTFVGKKYYFMTFDAASNHRSTSINKIIDSNIEKDEKLIVISFDNYFKITSFNAFATRSTGYSEKEVLGKNFFEKFIPASHQEKVKNDIEALTKDRRAHNSLNFPIVCKNGDKKVIKWEKTLKSKKADEEMFFLIGLNSDDNQEELNYFANYDLLTDLPNQNLLTQRLEDAIGRAVRLRQSMITLFLNIDNFKAINHTFGFSFGNKLLKMVSQRLCSSLRDYDTVARFSGDEFVLIFENINDETAAKVLVNRINELFTKSFDLNGNSIYLNINQGLSFFPSDANDSKTLIKHANLAMNYAKKKELPYQIFTASLSDELTNKAVLENNLKNAIKNGEFFIKYQPQVDTKTKKIIGAEALVRWNHPKLKDIPPLDFIPLAEDTGLIHQIGKIVLKDAITQTALWHKDGYDDLKISVNISGVQLLQSDLVKSIDEILKESNFNPKFLELELTESVLMTNIDLASKIMNDLRKRGIKFSIDDFGTGYSSFSYLSKMPLDYLKIDRTFIKNLTTSKNDRVITSAIINMAHSLSLGVIAEGVEEIGQYKYLKEANCDLIQGYYFGKPLTSEEFTQLLKDGVSEGNIDNEEYALTQEDLKEYKI